MKLHNGRYSIVIAFIIASDLTGLMMSISVAEPIIKPSANESATVTIKGDGNASSVFDFPTDHLLHQPSSVVANTSDFVEWLYWTGDLRDSKTDNLYGFQYALFQQILKPGTIGYVNHVAISDVSTASILATGIICCLTKQRASTGLMPRKAITGAIRILKQPLPIGKPWMPGIL
jgi:hypothetical protein